MREKSKVISFPHMGNYYIPAKYLFSKVFNHEVMEPKKITNRTIELGTKYSPEFVCTPFKYTLGCLIESLESGANILLQLGGGCRYGYYSELQEQILKDLGYDFKMINFITCGKVNLKRIKKLLKEIDENYSRFKLFYFGIITVKMIKYMDELEDFIRKNIGFEVEKNSFRSLEEKMHKDFLKVNNLLSLFLMYRKYKRKFRKIKIKKDKDVMRVGIIGELYTVMEPFSNYYIEDMLASYNIEVHRFTNADYLLFKKHKEVKKYLKYSKEYIKHTMGADAADNIARCKYMGKKKFDGIIHIKSSFCTPEIGAMPIISKVCKDYDIPVIFMSFDSNTSEVGIKTRLEAFRDMLEMRRQNG